MRRILSMTGFILPLLFVLLSATAYGQSKTSMGPAPKPEKSSETIQKGGSVEEQKSEERSAESFKLENMSQEERTETIKKIESVKHKIIISQEEFLSASQEKQKFIKDNPDKYEVIEWKSRDAQIIYISKEEFNNASEEKKEKILANPDLYKISE